MRCALLKIRLRRALSSSTVSLAAPVRVGPRSSATVALVVDFRGLLLDMRELNDALGELEGEVLLVDTRVRLSALGVTLRLDIPAAANISLSNMR